MAGRGKNKDFSSSPFRQLKGFCVSEEGARSESAPAEPPVKREADCDFAEEMARLGVKPRRPQPTPAPASEPPRDSGPAPAEDRELFLAALGQMDATFADAVPEPPPPPAPRLKQLLASDRFFPDGEIDLHGLDRLRAVEKVRHSLDNALYQGKKTVLLITGRGHGSTGEPVLRAAVEDFLQREAGPWVGEWAQAPRRLGGDGAFVVLLRRKKKE